MSELRWILLVAGVLFLIGLTAFESRRSRLARAAARERARAVADTIPFGQPGEGGASLAGRDAAAGAGPALGELPDAAAGDFPLDVAESDEDAIRAGPRAAVGVEELPSVPMGARDAPVPSDELERDSATCIESVGDTEAAAHAETPAQPHGEPHVQPQAGLHAQPPADADGSADAGGDAEPLPGGIAQSVTVEWPPEEQRRIVSVRIVSTSEQRLSGRLTRQALAACGFVHGRYRIFHQPDAQGHALLSCASLNKPGMFDPSSMDYQRYSGLSLFTVLPGPLAPPEAVDRLLLTALDLSERLHARLQDDAGQTLDDARIAELRTRYRELDAMAGPPA